MYDLFKMGNMELGLRFAARFGFAQGGGEMLLNRQKNFQRRGLFSGRGCEQQVNYIWNTNVP